MPPENPHDEILRIVRAVVTDRSKASFTDFVAGVKTRPPNTLKQGGIFRRHMGRDIGRRLECVRDLLSSRVDVRGLARWSGKSGLRTSRQESSIADLQLGALSLDAVSSGLLN